MFQAARNDYRVYPYAKSRGIALLVMLALILVAFTTIAISRLSQNSGEQKARAKTTQALIQSRDAIMAFALAPANPANTPPGTLPCPDTDGNGRSNPLPPSTSTCTSQRGLVPFVDLGISQPFDGAGAPIWYVVSNEYSGTLLTPFNSSRNSNLSLNGQAAAFILFAPSVALSGQNRPALLSYANPLYNSVTQFLEGENANATLNTYTDIHSDIQNDQVLGVLVSEFWANVEAVVMRQVKETLTTYFNNCSTLPSAVNSFGSGDTGTAGTTRGGLPFDLTTQCSTSQQFPNWIMTHWRQTLYYATCTSANCISLRDALGTSVGTASAIVIAPGVRISGPTQRIPGPTTITNYFEMENADGLNNIFTTIKSDSQTPPINDRIYVIR